MLYLTVSGAPCRDFLLIRLERISPGRDALGRLISRKPNVAGSTSEKGSDLEHVIE
jgi:hypothetical protein